MIFNLFISLLLLYKSYSEEVVEKLIEVISDLRSLPVDENDRLKTHWLLYNNHQICHEIAEREWAIYGDPPFYSIAAVEGEAEDLLFADFLSNDENNASKSDCKFVCLEMGTLNEHIIHPLPTKVHKAVNYKAFNDWMNKQCLSAELGMISYNENKANVFWVDPKGNENPAGTLSYGERHTLWQDTMIGHQFVVYDSITGELLVNHTVKHSGPLVVKNYNIGERPPDYIAQIKDLFKREWVRSRRVKRTFTELGFDHGHLPIDLFASMSTYFYNNRHNTFLEEWDDKGVFVNWWESEVSVIVMPWALKRYWQSRLKVLVEAWSGVELELTDIYGMRQYNDGARLMTHVDREQTHAASLIINVAQGGMREPWPVEIYDFADRLHEIEMNAGDIVYYESARCLHGRMRPLRGNYYVNLFAHYRPAGGDTQWFLKPNPSHTPSQLLDVGECTVENDQHVICSKSTAVNHLSPMLETLHGPEDLFKHWQIVGQNATSLEKDNFINVERAVDIDADLVSDEL